MHQFDEYHAELKGFSSYFHEEIFPLLAAQDGSRREAVKKAKIFGTLIVVIAIILAIFIFLRTDKFQLSFFALFFGGAGSFGLYKKLTKTVKSYAKGKIVSGICTFIGWTFQEKVTLKPDLDLLGQYGLIPKGFSSKHDRDLAKIASSSYRAAFEDQMSGQAHGADFHSVESHLERKNDDDWVTAFRGQIMTLTFPRKFLGQTVVLRDKGMFQSKKRGDMKRVGLVDPVFEKIFEAYSTDQVESRYLLDPAFMQKLVDLERSVDGKRIRFGFIEGQLHIVVETKNRYEAGSMLQPLTSPERTQKILDEIGAIYDIVDAVLAPSA